MRKKFCSSDKRKLEHLRPALLMFHPEQTHWASPREEIIDLPDSSHNTFTFPLICFLARYQGFINYIGWQIDLLLCPLSAECGGTCGCEHCFCVCERLCKCVREHKYCSHDYLCVVCFGSIICHLASKYRGHMVGKQMSLVRPANAKSRQMTSGETHTASAQTNHPIEHFNPLLTHWLSIGCF